MDTQVDEKNKNKINFSFKNFFLGTFLSVGCWIGFILLFIQSRYTKVIFAVFFVVLIFYFVASKNKISFLLGIILGILINRRIFILIESAFSNLPIG